MRKRYIAILPLLIFSAIELTAQEALLSYTERYYDFLALEGHGERPYINYRTLSDSKWSIDDGSANPWADQNLGTNRKLGEAIDVRIYGPDFFSSYNGDEPYGQNDGALWQGRGLNASLTAGARLEAYGFELTIKPQLTYSQNLSFPLMPSAYASPFGYIWALGYNAGADAPQRFGDQPLYGFSWGDSELRYSWKTLTLGIGYQAIWIGPGEINSIMQSNNAPPYPKIDVGIRKTPVTILGWYAGDVEARIWAGQLSQSDYFDGTTGGHNLISGLSLGVAPSFLPGLSLSFSRTYLAAWQLSSLATIPDLLFFQFNSGGGDDTYDQRDGIAFDYLLPKVGVEFYGEIAYNDNPGPNLDVILRNFSHTAVYTGGMRKAVAIAPHDNIVGQLVFEWSNLEMSPSYSQFLWANTFYFHNLSESAGYTNEGQWLGAGIGTGGNSQYLGFDVFYPKGSGTLYVYRYNPDNDFLLRYTTPSEGYPAAPAGIPISDETNFKTVIAFGIRSSYFVSTSLSIGAGVAYVRILDPLYAGSWLASDVINSYRLEFSLRQSL